MNNLEKRIATGEKEVDKKTIAIREAEEELMKRKSALDAPVHELAIKRANYTASRERVIAAGERFREMCQARNAQLDAVGAAAVAIAPQAPPGPD